MRRKVIVIFIRGKLWQRLSVVKVITSAGSLWQRHKISSDRIVMVWEDLREM